MFDCGWSLFSNGASEKRRRARQATATLQVVGRSTRFSIYHERRFSLSRQTKKETQALRLTSVARPMAAAMLPEKLRPAPSGDLSTCLAVHNNRASTCEAFLFLTLSRPIFLRAPAPLRAPSRHNRNVWRKGPHLRCGGDITLVLSFFYESDRGFRNKRGVQLTRGKPIHDPFR